MKKKQLTLIPALLVSLLTACNEGGMPSLTSQASRVTGGVSLTGASSDVCSGVAAWNSSSVYASAGMLVVQNGIEYKNNWWTQGNDPTTSSGVAGSGQPWTKIAICGTVTPTPIPTPTLSPTPRPTPTISPTPVPTTSPIPGQYTIYPNQIGTYTGGSIVQGSDGKLYQCLSNTVAPWCNQNNWAYAPATGTYWSQAWQLYNGPAPTPVPTANPSPTTSPTASPLPTPTTSPVVSPTPVPTYSPAPVTGTVFSAYKDVAINANWNNTQISTKVTNSSGSLNSLVSVLSSTPMNIISWSFATGECGAETWGGMSASQFASQNMADFNNAGYKYIVSTGGAAGTFTCSSQAGMDTFVQRYLSKGLVGFDFDIEGGPSGAALQSLINNIAYAQKKYGLRISFTLATLAAANPNGSSLNSLGDSVITMAKAAGIDFYVNLMVMDYGNSSVVCVMNQAGTNCDMNLSAQQAAKNLNTYHKIAFNRIELTPMIGINDTTTNIVSLNDASNMAKWVKANGIAGLHYWSWDRDTPCYNQYASPTCSSSTGAANGAMQTAPLQYLNAFYSGL